ncbi:MAG TPA: 30S ribosomal protein S6 [Chloroflexia bacterium]|jgi:small subunit ribosomal protein S6
MRDYELMYIVRPTVGDEEFPAATERVDGIIANLGGEVADKQPWGKRRLAYPIDKHEDGFYVVARVKLEPGRIAALEEQLRISEDVIRHVLVEPVAPHVPRQPRERPAPAEAEAPRR